MNETEFIAIWSNGFGGHQVLAKGTEKDLLEVYSPGLVNPAPEGDYQDNWGYDEIRILPVEEWEKEEAERARERAKQTPDPIQEMLAIFAT